MRPDEEKPPVVIEDMAQGVEAPAAAPVEPTAQPVEAQMAEIAPEAPVEQAPVQASRASNTGG